MPWVFFLMPSGVCRQSSQAGEESGDSLSHLKPLEAEDSRLRGKVCRSYLLPSPPILQRAWVRGERLEEEERIEFPLRSDTGHLCQTPILMLPEPHDLGKGSYRAACRSQLISRAESGEGVCFRAVYLNAGQWGQQSEIQQIEPRLILKPVYSHLTTCHEKIKWSEEAATFPYPESHCLIYSEARSLRLNSRGAFRG